MKIDVTGIQLGWDTWADICELADVGLPEEGKPHGVYLDPFGQPLMDGHTSNTMGLIIPGKQVIAKQGDWILRDINGNLYISKTKPGEK